MFGSIEKGYGVGESAAEWNVRGNIEARKKLMTSGANIILAPLDCTDPVILNDQYLTAIFNRQTPLTNSLGTLYALWYKHANWAIHAKMFDGVAIGMILWPDLFETEDMYVYVDDKRFNRVDKMKAPNCTIGMKIDNKKFPLRMDHKLIEQNYRRN
jgi:inosine-uridine nucleoside N-ribohydrolase